MAERRRFLLRLDADIHAAVEKWAADDLRSVNSQIEVLLTESLRRAGRLRKRTNAAQQEPGSETGASQAEAAQAVEQQGPTPRCALPDVDE